MHQILFYTCACRFITVTVIVKSVLNQSRKSSGSNWTIVLETTFNCSHARIKSGYESFGYCLLQIYMNFSESLLANIFLGITNLVLNLCLPKIIYVTHI